MTPTPEQIYKAAYWYNKNMRAIKMIKDLDTPHILAAYAAHCVAEAKDYYQSEAYQVIGVLANAAGLFEHPEVQRALDYFSGNGGDILPFVISETAAAEAVAEKDAEAEDIGWPAYVDDAKDLLKHIEGRE